MSKSIFPKIQLVAGLIATILVIIAYFTFDEPLQDALLQLDNMAARAESEINTAASVVKDIDGVAASLQEAIPSHRKSINSAIVTTKQISENVDKWHNEIPGFVQISGDASHICDTFANQLPIRIPAIQIETKPVKFQLPEVIPKTRTIDISYPTAEVEKDTIKKSYPSKANVDTKQFKKSLGRVAGKKLGEVKFDYPTGINIENSEFEIEYAKNISIGSANKSIEIPGTPELNMKDYSFDVPEKIEVTYRDLMKDEKKLLEKTSSQLQSLQGTLSQTGESLATIKTLLSADIVTSLSETDKNIANAERALNTFRTTRIPAIVNDLEEQHSRLSQSRQMFTTLSGLIPLLFAILALIPIAVTVSGAAKM